MIDLYLKFPIPDVKTEACLVSGGSSGLQGLVMSGDTVVVSLGVTLEFGWWELLIDYDKWVTCSCHPIPRSQPAPKGDMAMCHPKSVGLIWSFSNHFKAVRQTCIFCNSFSFLLPINVFLSNRNESPLIKIIFSFCLCKSYSFDVHHITLL